MCKEPTCGLEISSRAIVAVGMHVLLISRNRVYCHAGGLIDDNVS